MTLSDFDVISLEALRGLEPQPPLTPTGERLRKEHPHRPALWKHRISRSQKRKPTPVDAWLFFIGDSEFQTIPDPPQDPATGRLIEEHELGDYPPDLAERGRFFYEVRRRCQHLTRGRIPLTYQLRMRRPSMATPDAPVGVYSHPQIDDLFPQLYPSINYPKSGCFLTDYLDQLWNDGVAPEDRIRVFFTEARCGSSPYRQAAKERVLTLGLEAFFALADYADFLPYPMVQQTLEKAVLDGDLEMGRRMKITKVIGRAKGKGSGKAAADPFPSEFLELPLIAVIGDQSFAVRLHLLDPSAQLGQSGGSLAKYHACAGIAMDAKDAFSSADKGMMIYQWARAACHEKVLSGRFDRLIKKDSQGYLLADSIYQKDPGAFVAYSAGDVETLDAAIVGVEAMFREDLYGALGWADYYERIKLTAGASILDFVKAGFLKSMEAPMAALGDPWGFLRSIGCSAERASDLEAQWQADGVLPDPAIEWLLNIAFEKASSAEVAKENNLMATNAKVLGGRCINLAPNILSLIGVLIDMDLASAYTKSLTVQLLPFGRPKFIGKGYLRNAKNNGFKTLRQRLAEFDGELVPGLYQFWISCDKLPTVQDFFPTWDKPRAFSDYDHEDVAVWLERTDLVKHFLGEFTDSPLTHDGLQWLMNVADAPLRDYILDNALVTSAAIYRKSDQCSSPADFLRKVREWEEINDQQNTSEIVGNDEVNIERHCPAWFAVNLGELAINKFDAERQIHKKVTKAYKVLSDREVKTGDDLKKLNAKDQELILSVLNGRDGHAGYRGGIEKLIEDSGKFEKYPLDELFKLAANTTYGVMVSRFFILSNPIVGNNITARVRAMVWYAEKACGFSMSITDGGVFDANRVVYQRRDRLIKTEGLTLLHQLSAKELQNKHEISRRPIGGFKKIRWEDDGSLVFEHADPAQTRRFGPDQITGPDSAAGFIDKLTMEHTRKVFAHVIDKIDVLNPDLSPFEFEAKGIVREFALQGQSNYLLRGGNHGAYKGERETVAMRGIKKSLHSTYVAPFLRQLIDSPNAVVRGDHARVNLQGVIIKTGEYVERYHSFYEESFLKPGDSYYKAGLIREFSVSGLRFQTMRQMKLWESRHLKMRNFRVDTGDDGRLAIRGGQSFESFFTYTDDQGRQVVRLKDLVTEANDRAMRGLGPWMTPGTDHPSIEHLAITKFRLKALAGRHKQLTYVELDQLMKRHRKQIEELCEDDYTPPVHSRYGYEDEMENQYC